MDNLIHIHCADGVTYMIKNIYALCADVNDIDIIYAMDYTCKQVDTIIFYHILSYMLYDVKHSTPAITYLMSIDQIFDLAKVLHMNYVDEFIYKLRKEIIATLAPPCDDKHYEMNLRKEYTRTLKYERSPDDQFYLNALVLFLKKKFRHVDM